jgi:hypothetical protein
MGIAKRLTAVFVWTLVGGLNSAEAQSTPFNAESRSFRNQGWTYAIGYHAFSARPDSVPVVYQTVRPTGTIDTLHTGTWGHAGNQALRLGIGYWGIARRPLIWDRWFIELQGTRNAATSAFDGLVANADSILQPNTLLDSGRSVVTTELTFKLQRAFEIKTDFFFEVQLGIGWDREWGGTFSRTGPDSLFVTRAAPAIDRMALELGAGLGVRTRSGRYLRIHATYDGLQLAPLAEEGDGQVQWYEGHYQPWNLTLQWDLLRSKPLEDCAKPPSQDRPGEVLFGDQMQKDRRKQLKKQKRRAKKNRW